MDRIRVVIANVNEEAKITTIPDQIGTIEHLLGGYTDEYYLQEFRDLDFENICVLCNEEGLLNGLPINRVFENHVVVRGTLIVIKKTGINHYISLTEMEAKTIKELLNNLLTK